jgi:hypothetical protein
VKEVVMAAASLDRAPALAWRAGRPWFALTALVVFVAIAMQLLVTANATGGFFASTPVRVANVFAFFTIQSNLIVGVTSLLLATGRARPTVPFRVFRLVGIVNIALTGLVYRTLLVGLVELRGWGLAADFLLHTAVPLLAVVSWLAFGPRGLTSRRIAGLALLYPLAWLAFTLARGALIGWYPYPFLDVGKLGYGRVAANCLGIALVFVAVALGATALDSWLGRRRAGRRPPESPLAAPPAA